MSRPTLRFPFPERPDTVISRQRDAGFLNAVANDASVRPYLGGEGVIDLAGWVNDPRNVVCATGAGAFVGVSLGGGKYEIHSLFLPDGRGPDVLTAMREALDHLFSSSDAVEIFTKVPAGNRPARVLAEHAGFRRWFSSTLPWAPEEVRQMDVFALTLESWAVNSAWVRAVGAWFHGCMAAALNLWGSSLPAHSEAADSSHDQIAGAAALMIHAGNVLKAVEFYNLYATVSGFPSIVLLSVHPVLIDVGGVVVEIRGSEMEVVSCQ